MAAASKFLTDFSGLKMETDINPDDNYIEKRVTGIGRKNRIPFRERFDGIPQWTIVPEGDGRLWEFSSTNFGTGAGYNGFANPKPGERAWLVSPVLDLSQVSAASLFADFSYASRSGSMEKVKVAASVNCGVTFSETLFEGDADELHGGNNSSVAWLPSAETDWTRNFFDLSSVAGKKEIGRAHV